MDFNETILQIIREFEEKKGLALYFGFMCYDGEGYNGSARQEMLRLVMRHIVYGDLIAPYGAEQVLVKYSSEPSGALSTTISMYEEFLDEKLEPWLINRLKITEFQFLCIAAETLPWGLVNYMATHYTPKTIYETADDFELPEEFYNRLWEFFKMSSEYNDIEHLFEGLRECKPREWPQIIERVDNAIGVIDRRIDDFEAQVQEEDDEEIWAYDLHARRSPVPVPAPMV